MQLNTKQYLVDTTPDDKHQALIKEKMQGEILNLSFQTLVQILQTVDATRV